MCILPKPLCAQSPRDAHTRALETTPEEQKAGLPGSFRSGLNKEDLMIKRLQKIKSKRGFTLIELIVVIAVIAVLVGTILVGLDTTSAKVEESKSTASDFYSAIQTEFTNFQMYDGPLTMTLNEAYKGSVASLGAGNGGIKYYPAVGGNYPFAGVTAVGETHANGMPKTAAVYLEFYASYGILRHVNYSNSLTTLRGMTGAGNEDAQLCVVLKEGMKERMTFKDGYYYAKVQYTAPAASPGGYLSKYDYRSCGVTVEWAAYSPKEMTSDEDTYTFKSNNILRSGTICGVHTTTKYPNLGQTGTGFLT